MEAPFLCGLPQLADYSCEVSPSHCSQGWSPSRCSHLRRFTPSCQDVRGFEATSAKFGLSAVISQLAETKEPCVMCALSIGDLLQSLPVLKCGLGLGLLDAVHARVVQSWAL